MKRTGKILFSMAAAELPFPLRLLWQKSILSDTENPHRIQNRMTFLRKMKNIFPIFFKTASAWREETPAEQGIYLTADEAGFLKYILEGIENIGILTDSRIAEVEKLARKRKIPHTDRIREIKNACEGWDSDRELLQQCINDIREVLEGGFPEDFLEYVSDSQAAGSDAALS